MNKLFNNIERSKNIDKIQQPVDDTNSNNLDSPSVEKKDLENISDSEFLQLLKKKTPQGNQKQEIQNSLFKLISELREVEYDRASRFKEYNKAKKDPIIGQAIELMADDATQFDVDKEKTIWIECNQQNKKYQDFINDHIKKYVEPFIDNIAADIACKGESAFKVYKTGSKKKEHLNVFDRFSFKDEKKDNGSKKENGKFDPEKAKDVVLVPIKYIEKLHHLIFDDQSHYFAVTSDVSNFQQEEKSPLYSYDNFLHFINYSLDNSRDVQLSIQKEDEEGNVQTHKESVFALQGQSVLTDKVLDTYKVIRTIENGLVTARLTKSKIVRFVNVEVSKLSSEESSAIVNYVDGLVNKGENINTDQDIYTRISTQIEPVDVVLPYKSDKGQVGIDQFDDNTDIKEIVDLEHFMDKLFAGLRTPKTFFGYGEALPGGTGQTSLMRMDIRYARSVKKIQRVLVQGIERYIQLINQLNGIKEPPEYSIRVLKANTSEEEERAYTDDPNNIDILFTFYLLFI